jgi:DNA-binding MarR family transcriptional regulator
MDVKPNRRGSYHPDMATPAGTSPTRRPTLDFDPIDEARRQWIERGWSDAAPGMSVVTSIIRVEQLMMSRIDALLRPQRLTFARYELLVLLSFSREGALPLGKIGARLQVHPASVTNAVDRLEADHLVERVPHPEDGRTTLATITPAGRELAASATEMLNEQVFSDLGWDDEQLHMLFDTLHGFRERAGDFA